MGKTRWYDWLWVAMIVYLILPVYNILFAWIGLIFMITPVLIAVFFGTKSYCNKYCGRGQLYQLLGGKLKISRDVKPPSFLRARWFRYAFLVLFAAKFGMMVYASYAAFTSSSGAGEGSWSWLLERPWELANTPFAVEVASSIYMAMLATTVLGVLTMLLFKPRSWCVFCPMGTMTQEICRVRHGKEEKNAGTCAQGCRVAEGSCE